MELQDEIAAAVAGVRRAVDKLETTLGLWYPLYSQRDERWAGDRLGMGMGWGTLGGAGCAVTCAAMQATANGCTVTPGELNEWLAIHDGFTGSPRNLLNWKVMSEFCPLLEYRGKRKWRSVPANVGELRRVMEERGPVVVEVDFDYRDLDVDQHFVVALRWVGQDEVLIADPWDGAQVRLVERYFNPGWSAPRGKVARVVTGMRMLQSRIGDEE